MYSLLLNKKQPGFLLLVALLLVGSITAQEGKSFYKKGLSYQKDGQFQQALEQYDLAIKVTADYAKAFASRAEVKALLNDVEGSLSDYEQAARYDPKTADYAVSAAQAFLDHGYLNDAQDMCALALAEDPKNLQVLRIKVLASLTQGDINEALRAADLALEAKKTTDTYFYHGMAYYAARRFEDALKDFEKVIELNYLYEAAYIGQSEALLQLAENYTAGAMQMRTWEKVVRQSTTSIELNPESRDALIVRSKGYAKMKDYVEAINDVSKVVAVGKGNAEVYWLRANYYKEFGQYQNAINDLNRVLADREEDAQAYAMRADCHAANLNSDKAIKDLEKARNLYEAQGETTDAIEKRIAEEQEKVFETNREHEAPFIVLSSPSLLNDRAQVSTALTALVISGQVQDESPIASITINGKEILEGPKVKRKAFSLELPIESDTTLYTVKAIDSYGNAQEMSFHIERTEENEPGVTWDSKGLNAGVLEVFEDERSCQLNALLSDDSGIKRAQLNGVSVKLKPEGTNARMSHELPLAGVHAIVLLVEDVHGNIAKYDLKVLKKARPVLAAKPTNQVNEPSKQKPEQTSAKNNLGITWVVFIDNSNYSDYPSINNSSEEVRKMKKAFSSYTIHNTLRKKNMSKGQMDLFFKTELRDLVRKNKVNAVLVWYSGHGKYKGSKHYWIPVDAKKDNAYTYFDATRIKTVMKAYSTSMRQTMVVADAVGTDPSFYEMTR